MDTTAAPRGCGSSISSFYYNLCDLTKVWGVVVEAVAAAGVVTSLVLFIIILATAPFVTDRRRKSMAVLQAFFLLFTLGLFGLAFAFIIEQYSITCAVRRFLFGVLFAGCFVCLMMHGIWISLVKRNPKGWHIGLATLVLWLIEVLINTEWLIITVVRPPGGVIGPDQACSIENKDFVMALVYLLVLITAVVFIGIRTIALRQKRWCKDGVFILSVGLLTLAIWVTWINIYLEGKRFSGEENWDDPTLAIAVVLNALVFLVLYAIPEVCLMTQQQQDKKKPNDGDRGCPPQKLIREEEPNDGEHVCPPQKLINENQTIQEPEKTPQNVYLDNKAFEMDETPAKLPSPELQREPEPTKPVSPHAANNGQTRGRVYQPTPLAVISQGIAQVEKDVMVSRDNIPSLSSVSISAFPQSTNSIPS